MARKRKMRGLEEIIPLLSEDQMKVASGMITDALFMEKQLAALREVIERDGVSEQYQYGSKQTAAMVSYLKLQKQYGTVIRYLTDLIPKESGINKGDELLEFLRSGDD